MAIRIYVVEDHPIMRETLVEYLKLNDDFELCGVAASGEEALDGLTAARAALVLLDLSLPGRSGLDLLPEIQSNSPIPCIVLSGHREPSYVERALEAGARGYVLKGRPQEIPIAINAVLDGGLYVSESLRSALESWSEGAAERVSLPE